MYNAVVQLYKQHEIDVKMIIVNGLVFKIEIY